MRHVYTGDYIQPGNRRASPGVVPLGAVLMLCPAVQAFAWTFPVALDLAGFAATARARRLCLGSHHMEEGAARLFGPHHGDLVLRFGTGATPTSQAVDAAVARLAGFPRKLHFVATPLCGPQEAVFVSAYRYRLTSTVLAPAPGHSCHFLVLLVHPDTEQLPGVPAAPGMVLYPQRRLAHGDDGPRGPPPPTLSRPAPGSSADASGRDGTVLAQLPDLKANQRRRCAQFAALPPAATAGCECHQVVCGERQVLQGESGAAVPTPFGRRSLPQARAASRDECATAKGPLAEPLVLGPTSLCLSDLVAPPARGATFATSQDMIAFALGDHSREALTDLVDLAPLCNVRAKAGWSSLPWLPPGQRPDCLLLFTDSSYHPTRDTSSWAVVVLGTFQGSPYRLGAFAGRVPLGDGAPSFSGRSWGYPACFCSGNQFACAARCARFGFSIGHRCLFW
eukprot:s36_g25.t1